MKQVTVAIDVMGGDQAPEANLKGLEATLKKDSAVFFLLFGDGEIIEKSLKNYPKLVKNSEIVHCDEVILADDKPSVALRKGKNSSMTKAIEAVKCGEAHAVVSSGNTGALMAISKITLRTLSGILRPAIAAMMPSIDGKFIMLDLGANAVCSAENLLQFAAMGDAFARASFKLENPRIGILNIGSEDVKGNEIVKSTAEMMKNQDIPLNFQGFVEGDQLFQGNFDVVVADGFSGNVALKTTEGTASFYKNFLKKAFKNNMLAKIGYILAKPSLDKIFKRFDPRLYNGAMFLGLGGIVVKSHGGADDVAFASAVETAINLVRNDINHKITDEINKIIEQYPEFIA